MDRGISPYLFSPSVPGIQHSNIVIIIEVYPNVIKFIKYIRNHQYPEYPIS